MDAIPDTLEKELTNAQRIVLSRTPGSLQAVYRCEDNDTVIILTRRSAESNIFSLTIPSGQQFPWAAMDEEIL